MLSRLSSRERAAQPSSSNRYQGKHTRPLNESVHRRVCLIYIFRVSAEAGILYQQETEIERKKLR